MRLLGLFAVVLLITKKMAEFAFAFFCILLFGYGSFVMIRDFRKPGFFRGAAKNAA